MTKTVLEQAKVVIVALVRLLYPLNDLFMETVDAEFPRGMLMDGCEK